MRAAHALIGDPARQFKRAIVGSAVAGMAPSICSMNIALAMMSAIVRKLEAEWDMAVGWGARTSPAR